MPARANPRRAAVTVTALLALMLTSADDVNELLQLKLDRLQDAR